MRNSQPNLISLRQYLVVSEYNTTGYIIDTFEDMNDAQKVLRSLVDRYCPAKDRLYEQEMGYLSYKIHPTAIYCSGNIINQTTNGSYSVMIYSSGKLGFTIDKFVFERGNTVYAINFEQIKDENRFIKDYHPDLLAN